MLTGLLLGACAATESASTVDGALPTPYTADQIRAAHPDGTSVVFRIEVPGQPALLHKLRFFNGSAEGTRFESKNEAEDGTSLGEHEAWSSWEELRDHAAFPAASTRVGEARAEVPAGAFSCRLYTVDSVEEGVATTTRYWFAHEKPGPPVLMETEVAGEVTMRMELLSYR